jgi:hypothetical protein
MEMRTLRVTPYFVVAIGIMGFWMGSNTLGHEIFESVFVDAKSDA